MIPATMRETYGKMLDLAKAHRDAVMRGDFDAGEKLLEQQEALAQLISSAEDTGGVPEAEKGEILETIREIQRIHEEICSKLREEVRARREAILSTIGQQKALEAYGRSDAGSNIRFDRTK